MTAARPRHAESINRGRRQTAVFDLFGGENRQGRAEAVAGEKDRPRARLNQRREFRFDQRPRRVERRLKTFMRVIGSQPAIRIGHQIAIERGVGSGERGHDAVFALADNHAGVDALRLHAHGIDRFEVPERADIGNRLRGIGLIGELRHPHHGAGVVEVEASPQRPKSIEGRPAVIGRRELNEKAHGGCLGKFTRARVLQPEVELCNRQLCDQPRSYAPCKKTERAPA